MFLEIGKKSFQMAIEKLLQEAKKDSLIREILGEKADGFLSTLCSAYESVCRPFQLLIIGEYSTGKSTFINSLIGEDLFPVDLTPTDAVISSLTQLQPGQSKAEVHFTDGRPCLQCDSYQQAWEYVDGTNKERSTFDAVEKVLIRHPSAFLQDLEIVNTPGINSIFHRDTQVVKECLPYADAILWMFSAENPSGKCAQEFLEAVAKYQVKILGIFNMIDIFCEYDTDLEQYGPLEQERLTKNLAYIKDTFRLCQEFLPYAAKPVLDIRKQCANASNITQPNENELLKWGYYKLLVSLQENFFDSGSQPRQEKFQRIQRRLEEAESELTQGCQRLIQAEEKSQHDIFGIEYYNEKMTAIEDHKAEAKEKLEKEIEKTIKNIFDIIQADQDRFIEDTIGTSLLPAEQKKRFESDYLRHEDIKKMQTGLEKKAYEITKKMLRKIKSTFDSIQSESPALSEYDLGRVADITSQATSDLWAEQILKRPVRYAAGGLAAALTSAMAAGSLALPPLAIAAGIGAAIGGFVSWVQHGKQKQQRIDEAKKRAKSELSSQQRIATQTCQNMYYEIIDQKAEAALEELENQQDNSINQVKLSRQKCQELRRFQDHYKKMITYLGQDAKGLPDE